MSLTGRWMVGLARVSAVRALEPLGLPKRRGPRAESREHGAPSQIQTTKGLKTVCGVLGEKKGGTPRAYLIPQLLRARGVQGNPVTPGLRSDAQLRTSRISEFSGLPGAVTLTPARRPPGSPVCSVWKKMNVKTPLPRSLPNISGPSRPRQASSRRTALSASGVFPAFPLRMRPAPPTRPPTRRRIPLRNS